MPSEPSSSRRLRLPAWLPRVLVESGLIVFSVLLALVLNEWREDQARQERTTLALAAVRAELEENRRLVQDALEYHQRLSASFAASAERGDPTPDLGAVTGGLFAPGRVLRTAWEAAEGSGALTNLPYPTLLRLSTAYGYQAEYEDLTRAVSASFYEFLLREGLDTALKQYANLIPMQSELAGRERMLLARYEGALEALEHR